MTLNRSVSLWLITLAAAGLSVHADGRQTTGVVIPAGAAAGQVGQSDKAGPLEMQAKPIGPENPMPRRLTAEPPVFPAEALASGVSAQVAVRLTLDESGAVAEARGIGSTVNVSPERLRDLLSAPGAVNPDESRMLSESFARASIDAVRRWQFEPPVQAPISFNVTFRFSPRSDPQVVMQIPGQRDTVDQARAPGAAGAARSQAPASPSSTPQPGRTSEPLRAAGAIRVGGDVRPPIKTKHVNPVYPPQAEAARAQGVVILEVQVATDGRVNQARVLRSIPLLDQAALDAVHQWEFTPTLLNGVPTPVIMTVTVQFTLGG